MWRIIGIVKKVLSAQVRRNSRRVAICIPEIPFRIPGPEFFFNRKVIFATHAPIQRTSPECAGKQAEN